MQQGELLPPEIDIHELEKLLATAEIDTSTWGQGGAKAIDSLLKEIQKGETVLDIDLGGEVMRKVSVASAVIFYVDDMGNTYKLIEEKQVFSDGRERVRNLGDSVSEKMAPNEQPDEAIIRGIEEELGITGDINLEYQGVTETTADSPSYPGLTSKFTKHDFVVQISADQFNPAGYIEKQQDKSTYFRWLTVE